MRAAIYARMSTDKQSERSPTDQVRECRAFAERNGWHVVEDLVVEDAGVSGASRYNRPRLLELIARLDEWDVLLCWDFDRLARNSEDLGWVRNRLRAHRRTAYAVSNGLDVFNVGAKVLGILGEEYLVKLAADTHRGLRGRVERGLSGGGCPFGYRSVPVGEGQGSRWEPDPETAPVVRRIFELYAGAEGLRRIAHRLNAEGVSSPRPRRNHGKPGSWTVSSLHSLLRNPIYRGEYVWNQTQWIKDHETGKRKRYPRPESEWVRQHDEAWRIVSDELWEQAQESSSSKRGQHPRDGQGRLRGSARGRRSPRARHLLGGLLECGECGGSFFAVTRGTHYGCGWHRDRGPDVCGSTLMIRREDLEARVIGSLRDRILTPENLTRGVEMALAVVQRRLAENGQAEASDRKRMAELEVEIENATRLAIKSGHVDAVARVLDELERERVAIEARLAGLRPVVVDLDALRPRLDAYARDLRAAFGRVPGEKGRATLQGLLGDRRIAVRPDAERGFALEGLFELRLGSTSARPPQGTGRLVSVVAGAGFEPATSGL